MISIKPNKYVGLFLFGLLFIFPFSFQDLNAKWDIFFVLILGFLIISPFISRHNKTAKPFLQTALVVIFLTLFDFTEKVNFGQLFNIQIPTGWRIPLSTILLAGATLVFTLKVIMEKKLAINLPEYFRYFFLSATLLVILMILLFPFLRIYYNMSLDTDFVLLIKIFKYALLAMLLFSHLSNENDIKKFKLGMAICISTGLLLNYFL